MGVRVYQDVPRVYLDMDGPFADFEREIIVRGKPGKEVKMIPGIFRNLRLVPGARAAFEALRTLPIDLWFLTKTPDGNPGASGEKARWQREHFPEVGDHIIISPDKGAVGRPIDTLVDDHPEWANANNFPGEVIKFVPVYDEHGNSTNNWTEILDQLRKKYGNRPA